MIEAPTINFDTHFVRVPGFVSATFDPIRCTELLTHPIIGMTPEEVGQLHIYVRPDYELAYTQAECQVIQAKDPDDYDDAGCCEIIEPGEPFGLPGDVLMTLVYGAGFGVNALLCHEIVHARGLLRQTRTAKIRESFRDICLPKKAAHLDELEEIEADNAMNDLTLKGLRKGVITITRNKKAELG